jgi:hypothetical protein
VIESDWGLSRIVLQVITEERHGRAMREAKAYEDAQARRAQKEVGRGPR